MDKRSIIICSFLTLIFGTALHFVYEPLPFLWPVAPVNESVWEHLKLLVFPLFAFFGAASAIKKQFNPLALWTGAVSGMAFIALFFYTYTAFTKTHILWVDILSFVLAVALAAVVYKAVPAGKGRAAGIILSAALVAAMVLLTLFPPQIPLFMDPAGFYGMPVQSNI